MYRVLLSKIYVSWVFFKDTFFYWMLAARWNANRGKVQTFVSVESRCVSNFAVIFFSAGKVDFYCTNNYSRTWKRALIEIKGREIYGGIARARKISRRTRAVRRTTLVGDFHRNFPRICGMRDMTSSSSSLFSTTRKTTVDDFAHAVIVFT